MKNHLVWCDIPAKDLERAKDFYSKILAVAAQKMEGVPVVFFPHDEGVASGCIVEAEDNEPSNKGPLMYFSVEGRHDEADALVEENGGKLLKAKHQIGPYGFRSIILDSEGNRIALHSKN